jgi:cell fate (sporulation/competence/biofilm development) regulator YmcA (YheA/YmcA/DUF963 family)
MTPQLVQIAIGLIGALLGIAVTWGSQRRTVDQLTEAVKELTKKIELIAVLEKADALHAQEAGHQREAYARLESRVDRLEERVSSLPH